MKEKTLYIGEDKIWRKKLMLLKDPDYLLWKYVKVLRYTEYYYNQKRYILYYIMQRLKNVRGYKLGITIWHNTVGEGLKIWHHGSVVVNGHARIGKNCQLHGNNCIGNKGIGKEAAPIIGNNVDIGFGAQVIGEVHITDNVVIGSNAVVTRDCLQEGAILAGVPAKIIGKRM